LKKHQIKYLIDGLGDGIEIWTVLFFSQRIFLRTWNEKLKIKWGRELMDWAGPERKMTTKVSLTIAYTVLLS
jgi:hypothetical protein